MQSTSSRIRLIDSATLSDDWYLLKKYTFDFLRRDGSWQRQTREPKKKPATGSIT